MNTTNFMRILLDKDTEFWGYIESIREMWEMNPNLENKFKKKDVKRIIKFCEQYLKDKIPHN